ARAIHGDFGSVGLEGPGGQVVGPDELTVDVQFRHIRIVGGGRENLAAASGIEVGCADEGAGGVDVARAIDRDAFSLGPVGPGAKAVGPEVLAVRVQLRHVGVLPFVIAKLTNRGIGAEAGESVVTVGGVEVARAVEVAGGVDVAGAVHRNGGRVRRIALAA